MLKKKLCIGFRLLLSLSGNGKDSEHYYEACTKTQNLPLPNMVPWASLPNVAPAGHEWAGGVPQQLAGDQWPAGDQFQGGH